MLLRFELGAPNSSQYAIALAALTALDEQLLAAGAIPPLYRSGTRYRRERPDVWTTADICYRRGYGDCEDLAAWRCAELRRQGILATVVAREMRPRKFHAVVRWPDGRIEDPSKRLGM